MLQFFKSHFTKKELISVLQSFAAMLLFLDTVPQFQLVLNGDYSKSTLMALMFAILRSAVKLLCSAWAIPKNNLPIPPMGG